MGDDANDRRGAGAGAGAGAGPGPGPGAGPGPGLASAPAPAPWGPAPKPLAKAPAADALEPLLPLLRQLRDIKGVREASPGRFVCRQIALVQLVDDAGAISAELTKAGGLGVDRYPLDTPARQRKLVDDAKRRAAALDDE